MPVFKSWRDYWNFSANVKLYNRYVHKAQTKKFLRTVADTSKSRKAKLKERTILWRAQLGYDLDQNDNPIQFSLKRMFPIANRAREGRANPKGIPYLYLATDKNTAVSEVRPGVGSFVSVAKFITKSDLLLIDCSNDQIENRLIYLFEPDDSTKELEVWSDINLAFSTPVNPTEDTADYAPTQILADLFKAEGYNGIIYKSSLAEGKNIVLFDIKVADSNYCELHEVQSVKIKSKVCTNPSFKD